MIESVFFRTRSAIAAPNCLQLYSGVKNSRSIRDIIENDSIKGAT